MDAYTIAEAKTHLSRLIDRAVSGHEVVITRHGRAVARIQPISAPREKLDVAWLARRLEGRPRLKVSTTAILRRLRDEG